jgi:hypothetical protein
LTELFLGNEPGLFHPRRRGDRDAVARGEMVRRDGSWGGSGFFGGDVSEMSVFFGSLGEGESFAAWAGGEERGEMGLSLSEAGMDLAEGSVGGNVWRERSEARGEEKEGGWKEGNGDNGRGQFKISRKT